MQKDIIIESAEIIAIGTELLIGQTLNTNTHFLAKQLNLLGINSYYQTVVGDNPKRLETALRTAVSRSDLIITSGGLGPTADDISMALAAKVAGRELILDETSVQNIKSYFVSTNRTPCENNWKQAMLPEGSEILPNHNGTAPGAVIVFEYEGKQKAIACLPGPPDELNLMFKESLYPWLKERVKYHFVNRFLHLIGIGESDAEMRIKDIIERQDNPTIAPYASPGEVCFRLTERIEKKSFADEPITENFDSKALDDLTSEVYQRLGQYVYEEGERKLPEIVFGLLKEKGESIAFAESCTAGMISEEFGEVPGVSEVFKGGIVSYSNEAKHNLLNVSNEILEKYGAVSEETALAMAEGAAKALNSDLAISVTGIAGPGGGSKEKPVGTVYIASYYHGKTTVKKYLFKGVRNRIRHVSTLRAFHLAWQNLTN